MANSPTYKTHNEAIASYRACLFAVCTVTEESNSSSSTAPVASGLHDRSSCVAADLYQPTPGPMFFCANSQLSATQPTLVPSPYGDPFPDPLPTVLTSSTQLQYLNDLCIKPPIDRAQRGALRDDYSLPDFFGIRLSISAEHQKPHKAQHHMEGKQTLLDREPASNITRGCSDAAIPRPSHTVAALLLTSDPGVESVLKVMQCLTIYHVAGVGAISSSEAVRLTVALLDTIR